MIRLWRGGEPEALAKARRRYLASACLAWERDEARDNIEGYDVAREGLYRAQHRKCAYCERQEGLTNQPVEHFRPKGGADRVDPLAPQSPHIIDKDHYFWLAWSWENLFFACSSCNGKGTKGNRFPLLDDTTKLPLPPRELVLAWERKHFDRRNEKAMLIDPALEDPMSFIQWLPENPNAAWDKLRWAPQGIDPEKRGARTIKILGLDKELPDHVSASVCAHVEPAMTRLRSHWQNDDRQRAADEWDRVERMFAAELPYLAATYNAIEWFLEQMGLTDLERFIGRRLEALRPGVREDEVPSHDIPDPPECASLPVELVLRARAEKWTAREAVLALCRHRVWDDPDALAKVLGFATSTVLTTAQALAREGKIKLMATGGIGPLGT